MRRGRTPIALADLLLLAALTAWASPAVAIVTSNVVGGVLTVTSDDEDDEVVIRCTTTGLVRVNGAPPSSGAVACTGVSSIKVFGGAGFDHIRLQQVDPAAFTSLTAVSIDGGPGSDYIVGSLVDDSIIGGDGNDEVTMDALADAFDGGLGRDFAIGEVAGEVTISDDTLQLTSVEHLRIEGSDENDTINASRYTVPLEIDAKQGDDRIQGGSDRNILSGGSGNDVIEGGPERDRVSPGLGDDSVDAGDGNDFIGDQDGADDIRAGPGNDLIFQIAGRGNHFEGGPGRDELHLETVESVLLTDERIRFRSGQADISSFERADLLLAPDISEGTRMDASGFSGSTLIRGQFGDDTLIGGSGKDEISASWGDDTVVGGAGRDRLDGSRGRDSCDGGPGRDRLIDCELP